MKSGLDYMLQIWSFALYDAKLSCAMSQVGYSRDLERLTRHLHTRGLGCFTLDLPNLDTVLLSLLEEGKVVFEGHFCARRSRSDLRPAFLWDLWRLVCDESGCLLKDPSPEAMLSIRQLSSFWKKLEVECSPARINAAVEEFYDIEDNIPNPTLDWVGRDITGYHDTSFELFYGSSGAFVDDRDFLRRLDKVSKILVSGIPIFDSMSEDTPDTGFFKHGPGAVSNLRSGGYKYSFPNWSDSLERLFPFDWCAGGDLLAVPILNDEPKSKLLQVPKTAKTPRLIASEPLEHQWCQQKIKTFLDFHFRKSVIGRFFDPCNQALSQRLVALAARDRSLSTIDLSSASDRVSCVHIERLFNRHPSLLEAMMHVRTQKIVDTLTGRGTTSIRKFSTMGSALTFPIQSLFFLTVALASAGAYDRRTILDLEGKVRVFGDDIIVPLAAHEDTVRRLNNLGLKVNKKKSFFKGSFRESCGADCWGDYDITPVKPKVGIPDTPAKYQAAIDTSNNLFKKGFWRAANRILEWLPPRFTENVFRYDAGVPGVFSYSGTKVSRLKYDKDLQRYYVPQPTLIKKVEVVTQDNSFALREFFSRPWSSERPRETGTKRMTKAMIASVRVDAHALGLVS